MKLNVYKSTSMRVPVTGNKGSFDPTGKGRQVLRRSGEKRIVPDTSNKSNSGLKYTPYKGKRPTELQAKQKAVAKIKANIKRAESKVKTAARYMKESKRKETVEKYTYIYSDQIKVLSILNRSLAKVEREIEKLKSKQADNK